MIGRLRGAFMIELKQLQKVVGESTLIAIEELTVNDGEVVALVGPAGSGKSELLALLTGQVRPTSGTVRVCGLDPVKDRNAFAQKVGVLFAEDSLYPRLSARDNLLFHCQLRGLPTPRADEVLAQVGLADRAAVLAERLGPSLARRLALGRAILHRPTALFLVNPFADCDADSTALLGRLIRDLADAGAAVLILSTEMTGLAELCRAIYLLEQGHITQLAAQTEERRFELPFKVPAKQEGQVALVNPADILYASTQDEQTLLHTTHGEVPSHLTLTELEERLAHNGFFRAHRGYLVNLQRVKAVVPYTRDSFSLILDDPAGTEIPLSKTAARELRTLLGY